MKKWISILLSFLMVLGLPLIAAAAELTNCTVTADSLKTLPGMTITVPIRISENQGFTNFAMILEYDHDVLELKSIDVADGENPYLCGTLVSTNTEWKDAQGETYGYITAASDEAVTENGILFTATFAVSASFTETTEVSAKVQYVRNNAAVFTVFEEIAAVSYSGVITAILPGDLNGDGVVEYDDVMLAYQASLAEAELTADQITAADINEDGSVDSSDVEMIYQIYIGG